jgi:tungstate transport system permease protein
MCLTPKHHEERTLPIQDFVDAVQKAFELLLSLDPTVVEIALRSLQVTVSALLVGTMIGIPIGAWIALTPFPGKRIVTALVYTGMGIPPVLVGLTVYLLLSRSGPLGNLGWLFTTPAMVIAQIVIAVPVIIGMTMSSILAVDPMLRPQLRALGATHAQAIRAQLYEARMGVIVGLVAGFGSIISEVGAVMLVGGNIEGRTRVLTTAVVQETRQGNFDLALAFGFILLAISFISNFLVVLLQGRLNQ